MDTSVNVQRTIPVIIVKSMIEYAKITPVGEYINGNSIRSRRGSFRHDGTCKEMQQIVALVNETIFHCDCKAGYDGIRCQSAKNTCENITCANNGVCFSSYPTWTCVCLDSSLYSGTHCQHKSNALLVQQVLSKSFASIAITAIIVVFLFVTVMDVLKYGFKIDPVDRERRLMKLEEEKRQKRKGKKPTVIKKLQSYYIS